MFDFIDTQQKFDFKLLEFQSKDNLL